MTLKKTLYIMLGFLGLVLGGIGVVVPMLPAFPFLLLAAFGFARGSERLHQWFLGTKLYKDNLETYVQNRSMTRRTKRRIMLTVSARIAISMTILALVELYWVWGILLAVWLFHMIYFIFKVKTLEP